MISIQRDSLSRHVAVALALQSLLWITACKPASVDSKSDRVAAAPAIERSTEKGPIKLLTRVMPPNPRLSDVVELELLITAQEGFKVEPPAFGQSVGDFLVLDYGERKKDIYEQPLAPNQRAFRYRLEPVQAGKHLIRSLRLEYLPVSNAKSDQAIESIESEPIEIEVTSEWGTETPDLAQLEPMLPPKEVPSPIAWVWWIPAGIVMALGIIGLVLLRKSRSSEPVMPVLSPSERAQRQLAALLAENLHSTGRFAEFYVRLTGIVRQYVEGTTGIHAPEQTTEEFLRDMHASRTFTIEHSERLQQFLEAADMVKYAGQTPDPSQIESSIARAREFVHTQFTSASSVVNREL
jgi:hypothetical protein